MRRRMVLIGAAIVDVLVRPAGRGVFDTGSFPAEDIRMSFGGDALNEAAVLAALGKQVTLHTVLGRDPAGDMIRGYCSRLGAELISSEHAGVTGPRLCRHDEAEERRACGAKAVQRLGAVEWITSVS